MTSSRMAGDPVPPAASRAENVAFAASALFLFVAPIAGSAGARATCLIVIALALAFAGTWRQALERPPPRALVVVICAWFLLAPLSLAWTRDLGQTLTELRAETFYGALAFLGFFTLASDARRWRVWCIALLAGTLVTLAAKGVQQDLGIALWHVSPDGGPGAFSTHLVLIAPLLATLVCPAPWGYQRGAIAFAAALALLVAAAWGAREPWTTPNRIVWIAFAAAFVVAIAAGRRSRAFNGAALPALRRVAAVGGLAIALGFVGSIAAKNERFFRDDPSITASVDRDLRPRLWFVALEAWKSAPWLGHGFGREILAEKFLPETPAGVNHPPVRQAHNVFLNVALELGFVGLAAFVALLALLARHYATLLARPDVAVLGAIGLALLAGFVTKNLTDDFMHRHNAQVFWALNGMLLGFAGRARPG